MDKVVKLKDGTEVHIRQMREDDIERSFAFFQDLPAEDRLYLRSDVTRRSVVEDRIKAMAGGLVERLVAEVNGQIVADGSLEVEGHDWKEHVGELRLIVAKAYQGKRLGLLLARELYLLAASKRVEEVMARMMGPQLGARKILQRLGFREETVLPGYVKDLNGAKQDLIIMRCNLRETLRELEDYLAIEDWQRAR
jgi:L-amino acid N-acyltransferase YncA